MYVLCKKTTVATTLGVYNVTELIDAEEQCIMHNYDSGNCYSQAITNKKTGDTSIKAQKESSPAKKENRCVITKTAMSISNDVDFVLRSTWNVVI